MAALQLACGGKSSKFDGAPWVFLRVPLQHRLALEHVLAAYDIEAVSVYNTKTASVLGDARSIAMVARDQFDNQER